MVAPGLLRAALLAIAAATAAACGADDDAGDDDVTDTPLAPPAAGEGFQMSMTTVAPAGSEIWTCRVYGIPTDQWEMVNRVESVQNDGMHHMDITALAFAGVSLEPGDYDCTALYDQYPELMEDGMILYAAQSPHQLIELPAGTAANLPPRLTVMHEIHYVNTTEQDVEVFSYVNAYTMHPSDVTETIWGGAVRDTHLAIPANGEHDEWTRCVMTEDIDLLFLTSHTHQLGREVTVRLFDGTDVGEQIYVNRDWQTPYLHSFGTTPLHIRAGQGFEFNCRFNNITNQPVAWGFAADEEMCQIALVFTPGEARRKCEPVASSDGVF